MIGALEARYLPSQKVKQERERRTEALDRRNLSVDIEGKYLLGSIGTPATSRQ